MRKPRQEVLPLSHTSGPVLLDEAETAEFVSAQDQDDEDFELLNEENAKSVTFNLDQGQSVGASETLAQQSVLGSQTRPQLRQTDLNKLSISKFDPQLKRRYNRIPIHDVYRMQEDNKVLEAEINKCHAHIQRLKDE